MTDPPGPFEHRLPSYAYVPGGPWPHPSRSGSEVGRSGRALREAPPIRSSDGFDSEDYLRGFALFLAGYYWEAHEAWESLWHAHGRRGATADVLKAWIKLAAAGVKVRERQPRGVVTHARRAAALFGTAEASVGRSFLGLELFECRAFAERVAESPPDDPAPPGARVSCVFRDVPIPRRSGGETKPPGPA